MLPKQSSHDHLRSPQPHRVRASSTGPSIDQSTTPQTENVSVCVRVKPIPTTSLSDIDPDTPTPQHRQHLRKENPDRFGSWLISPAQALISLSPSHPIIDRRGTGTSEAINGSEGYEFKLDQVFDPFSTTADLYRSSVQSLVESCVKDGYNVTVFAYGQTGSGKTFTMMGSKDHGEDETLGVIPRAVAEVFDVIASDSEREYLLRVSYLEIYNEALKDLLVADQPLSPTNRLAIHENNKGRVHVNGIREEVVTHPMQVLDALTRGEKARHVGATDWNERSSRSHTVFTMTIESRPKPSASTPDATPTQLSQLNLIDLAGSESAASSTERRKEGSFINKSLLALSNVISKLSKHEAHIPYRDSKLTRLLQTSLKGNAKVVVICTVSADARSVVETLSTLRFARRAKMVVTKAERGTILDDKSALLQAYQQEITSLKAQLQQNAQALSITTTSTPALAELNAEKSKAESELTTLRFERIRLQEQIEHLNRRILTSQSIEANVRRANSIQPSIVSPSRRRIASGQVLRPKKSKPRITDVGVGGMMGLLGIGISTSGYLPSSSAASIEDSRANFRRELQLEKELSTVRHELVRLTREKSNQNESPSSGLDLLKDQIRALEGDKENLPLGVAQEDEQARRIQVLEDEIEMMRAQHQRLAESNAAEIQSLKLTINSLETSKEIALGESQEQLTHRLQEPEDELKKTFKETESSYQLKLAELQNEIATSQSQHAQQEESTPPTKNSSQDSKVAELQQSPEGLENDHKEFKAAQCHLLQDSELKISTLEAELNAVKQDRDQFASHLQEKKELVSKLESELTSLSKSHADTSSTDQERVQKLEKEKLDVQAEFDELRRKLDSELSALRKDNENLVSAQQESISQLEAEKVHVEQLQTRLELELTSRQKDQHDSSLAQQAKQNQELISKLENEKSEAHLQLLALKSQSEAESHPKNETSPSSIELEQIAKLETEKSELLAQVEELKSRLETKGASLRGENESTSSAQREPILTLRLERPCIRDDLEELPPQTVLESNQSIESDSQGHVSSPQQKAELEVEWSDAQMKYESLISTLQMELDCLRKEKEAQLSAHQQEIAKMQTELTVTEVRLKDAESSVSPTMESLLQDRSDRISTQEKQIAELESERSSALSIIEDLKIKLDTETESCRKDKEEFISSQKEHLEKLELEKSEAQAKIEVLLAAAQTSTEVSEPDQGQPMSEVMNELSEARLQIDNLTVLNAEKEHLIETLQNRISSLETELGQVGIKVEKLLDDKSRAEENVEKKESDHRAQLKTLETEIMELRTSLDAERTARFNIGREFSEKAKSLKAELSGLSSLQSDASNLKTQLDILERRLSAERHKSHEKELEVMQLIAERDQAQGKIETLELSLNQLSDQKNEDVESIIRQCDAKVQEAEGSMVEAQSGLTDLRLSNHLLERKLEIFQSETEELKVSLKKIETERASQELHQSKLEKLSARLQDDLTKMQDKEKAMMDRIESITRERCEATILSLQENYNSKLMRLEQSNSNLETHIKTLESHLATVGHGSRQQTTAESMETIVDLQGTIDDQNREIKDLRTELENVKKSSMTRPLQSIHNRRLDHDHYHQSTEDELNRLYHIIDEQEKRLSDAKTDLSKWQARVRSQTEIISKLKISSESDFDPKPTLLRSTSPGEPRRGSDQTLNVFSSAVTSTPHSSNRYSPTKLAAASPSLGGATRPPGVWQSNFQLPSTSSSCPKKLDNNSPRPLPVPQSFLSAIDDDEAQRRKNRRRTIEKDMAKLKDNNLVEKKLNSLLSSAPFNPSAGLKVNQESESSHKAKAPPSPLTLGINRFEVPPTSILTSKSINSTTQNYSTAGTKTYQHHRQSSSSSPFSTTTNFSSSSQKGYYE